MSSDSEDRKQIVSVINEMLPQRNKLSSIYYANNVKMTYSFDTLRDIIKKEFKKDVKSGDIFVFDSPTKKARKAMMRTNKGWCILYIRNDDGSTIKEIEK